MTARGELYVTRRALLGIAAAGFATGIAAGAPAALLWASRSPVFLGYLRERGRARLAGLARKVLPPGGYETAVVFGDSIRRLVAARVISPTKFRRRYAARGGLPDWVEALFDGAGGAPITFSAATAPYLLNLLWPLGIANRAGFNRQSPLNGPDGGRFASTGGWTLGKAARGGGYFDRVVAIELNEAQEETVVRAAEASFRPCCDNSTLFQDCNHGSALLGLYQLAAAQGASVPELFRLGLAANSTWYPDKYLETALLFERLNGRAWEEAGAGTLLAARYSSLSGWRRNVHAPLRDAGLVPGARRSGGAGCAV